MPFEKINIIQSPVVATSVENIDTDQIIPARFLKSTSREGFGKALFMDWRYTPENKVIEDSVFALASPDARILVAGKNFGCGSSREHAAWALTDYGFKAVVSSFFADIFKNNALNNGLLPVQVSERFLKAVFQEHKKNPQMELRINLPEKTVEILQIPAAGKIKTFPKDPSLEETPLKETILKESFPIGSYKQQCLMNGQQDIDYLLSTRNRIEEFERGRSAPHFALSR